MWLERVVGSGHAESKRPLGLRNLDFTLGLVDNLWRVVREREAKQGAAVSHSGYLVQQRWEAGQVREEASAGRGQDGCRRQAGVA